METYIIAGVLLLLVWLYIYFNYFREKGVGFVRAGLDRANEAEEVYSVAPWGADGSDGSLAAPWKTLQYAVNQLQPGDTLLIRAGVYNEPVSFKTSGARDNPILVNVLQGEEALLDGEGAGGKYGFNLEYGVSFVTLKGFKVKNFKGYGIALWGENHSVQLIDLEVLGCGAGLSVISAGDLLVEDCHFHNNSGSGLVVSPGPLNEARIIRTRSSFNESPELPDGFILDSGEGIVIEKCVAEYNAGSGYSLFTARTLVSACIARFNGRYGMKCAGEGYKLVNCLIDSSGMAGIALPGGGSYELFNNLTVYCGLKGDFGFSAAPEAGPSSVRVSLVNNIFAFNYGGAHFGSAALLEKEDHNLYWSREDAEISTIHRRYSREEINEPIWFKESGRGEHSFCRDPMFVDPAGHDFRLAINSPAIDRGTREGAPGADMDGSLRPRGRGVDIGPYESAEGSLIPPAARVTCCPVYSTDQSDSPKFRLKWAGFADGRNLSGFNVQYKDGLAGTWQNWLADTVKDEEEFLGLSAHTYYFRVRAKDEFGYWGNWSDERCAVVPVDDQNPLIKYEGGWDLANQEESYLNTLHHSANHGAAASLRFTGAEAAWISTTGPDRGQAHVYVDGALQDTIDLYSAERRSRRPVFTIRLDGKPHTIRVEVAEAKNPLSEGGRVDVDGFAVRS